MLCEARCAPGLAGRPEGWLVDWPFAWAWPAPGATGTRAWQNAATFEAPPAAVLSAEKAGLFSFPDFMAPAS